MDPHVGGVLGNAAAEMGVVAEVGVEVVDDVGSAEIHTKDGVFDLRPSTGGTVLVLIGLLLAVVVVDVNAAVAVGHRQHIASPTVGLASELVVDAVAGVRPQPFGDDKLLALAGRRVLEQLLDRIVSAGDTPIADFVILGQHFIDGPRVLLRLDREERTHRVVSIRVEQLHVLQRIDLGLRHLSPRQRHITIPLRLTQVGEVAKPSHRRRIIMHAVGHRQRRFARLLGGRNRIDPNHLDPVLVDGEHMPSRGGRDRRRRRRRQRAEVSDKLLVIRASFIAPIAGIEQRDGASMPFVHNCDPLVISKLCRFGGPCPSQVRSGHIRDKRFVDCGDSNLPQPVGRHLVRSIRLLGVFEPCRPSRIGRIDRGGRSDRAPRQSRHRRITFNRRHGDQIITLGPSLLFQIALARTPHGREVIVLRLRQILGPRLGCRGRRDRPRQFFVGEGTTAVVEDIGRCPGLRAVLDVDAGHPAIVRRAEGSPPIVLGV